MQPNLVKQGGEGGLATKGLPAGYLQRATSRIPPQKSLTPMARAWSTDGELAQTWHSSASHQNNKASPALSSNKHFLRTERQEKKGKNPTLCLLLSLHHKKHGLYQSRNPTFLSSATWSTAVTPGK